MAAAITRDDLRAVPVFSKEADEHLDWLAGRMSEAHLEAGDLAYRFGDEANHMVVLLSGSVQLLRHVGEERRLFGTVEAGGIFGLLPYSRMVKYGGDAAAVVASRLAKLHRDDFPEMVHRMPDVGQTLVGMMSDRVRAVARGDQQREKMMALGKLSAGLAHELNNPAAAVRRSAAALRDRLRDAQDLAVQIATHGLSDSHLAVVNRLHAKAAAHVTDHSLSALDRSQREDELTDWLEGAGVDEAWKFAEGLVEAGLTPEDLDDATDGVPAESVAGLITWIAATLDADRILQEIEAASARISDLVGAVKAYTHMDRAPEKQRTDIRDGLDSTLTMLGHRLKAKSIAVEKEFSADLPAIVAHGGELNQVWTNLIDNAIDAMPEGGHLRVRARKEGGMVAVTITDDGPGIPPDVRPRIFEPFFTTKEVGQGTGLGLEIVERIVREHGGDVTVDSKPGETTFRVLLPA